MVRTPKRLQRPSAVSRTARAGAAWLAAGAVALAWATVGSLDPAVPMSARPVNAASAAVPLDEPSAPVRIRVPALGIDLPVVSSERNVAGNRRGYPLCDVAQHWTEYDLPGAPGTTWIYAHAQPGMFLPLLLTAQTSGDDGLAGKLVTLQLRDGRLLRYRINDVRQHVPVNNRRIAQRSRPGEHRLVLQTSEGPPGTDTRLQMSARLVGATRTDLAAPRPRPRACWQPRTGTGPRATAAPDASETEAVEGSMDPLALALGTGAVLFGATLIAVVLVRRQP